MPQHIDSKLETWSKVAPKHKAGAILLGNGASRAVWDRFGYASLFQHAQSADAAPRLSLKDIELFTKLQKTTNFEAVLGALATARLVGSVLGAPVDVIADRYETIKAALVGAVHSLHVPWEKIRAAVLLAMREELLKYSAVYSTNYDLLLYWSMMAGDAEGFKDFFWQQDFDIANAGVWGGAVPVYYLHGALHLYKIGNGTTRKDIAPQGQNLLQRFGQMAGAVPLLVSEGTSEDKLRSITRSDYLSFALDALGNERGPLTIFGHSLSNEDAHLVRAIRRHKFRKVLVSTFPGEENEVISFKAGVVGRFPGVDLSFFDSTTHPLGVPSQRIV